MNNNNKIKTHIQIQIPVEQVFEYYINPANIKTLGFRISSKNQKTYQGKSEELWTEMKMEGEYIQKKEEMTLSFKKITKHTLCKKVG